MPTRHGATARLPLDQVVDLYGRRGFDVLCVTDHVVRGREMVTEERHPAYLAAIREQAARAEGLYGMLVIPGLELTYDDPADSTRSAHAVAVGLERFVAVERGIGTAMEERAGGGCRADRGPSARRRSGLDPRPHDAPVLARPGAALPRAPLRAYQPPSGVRLGGGRRPAGGGQRRLPRPGARRHVEDAPAMRPGRRPAWSTSCARRRRPPSPASSPRPCRGCFSRATVRGAQDQVDASLPGPKSSARRPDATTGSDPVVAPVK